MSYVINYLGGTITLPLNQANTTATPLTLVGRNWTSPNIQQGYGQAINQNFVSLLENFANSTSPTSPLTGQLWYDPTLSEINLNIGTPSTPTWTRMLSASSTISGIANVSSNVSIPVADGNVNTSINGVANVFVVSPTGANVTGAMSATGRVTGNTLASTVTTGTAPITVASQTMVLNLNSQYSNGYTATVVDIPNTIVVRDGNGAIVANTIRANISLSAPTGNITTINSTTINSTTVAGSLTTASQPNITAIGTLTSLTVTGAVTADSFTGNINGNATTAGTVRNGAQPNITSVGTLAGLTATGAVNFGGSTVTFGQPSNVRILGGTNGSFLITDGTGGLSWSTAAAPVVAGSVTTPIITTGAVGTAGTLTGQWTLSAGSTFAATTANTSGTVTTADQPNITSVGTLTGLTSTGVVNFTDASNVTLGPVGNVRITGGTAGDVLSTDGLGGLSWISPNGAPINTTLVTTGSAATAGTMTGQWTLSAGSTFAATTANTAGTVTTAAQPNITSVGTLTGLTSTGVVNFTGASNVAIGDVANLYITGGTQNSFLITNGSGDLSWSTNTTPVTIGPLVTANISAGAVATAGTLAGQWSMTAGSKFVATTITDAAQPNITSTGTLTSLAVSGTSNLNAVGNITITGGTSGQVLTTDGTGALSWTTVAGSSLSNGVSSVTIPIVDSTVITTVGGATRLTVTTAGANISGILAASTSLQAPSLTSGATATAGTITGQWTVAAGSTLAANTATTAGTITTAAQPNITSTGTLTSLAVSGTSNLNAVGNVTITGGTAGQVLTTDGSGVLSWTTVGSSGVANGTSSISIPVVNSTVITTVNGASRLVVNSTGANVTGVLVASTSVRTPSLTTGATATAGTITGQWTLATGSTLNASYADLAEYYTIDRAACPGTVVEFGGDCEITVSMTDMSQRVAGVISTAPAFTMNDDVLAVGKLREAVALQGRVPCRVVGICHKGDMMVSAGNGAARSEHSPLMGSVIGKALEDKLTEEPGIIEVVVGRL